MTPGGVVGCGSYSLPLLLASVGGSLPPVGEQPVELDCSRRVQVGPGHVHAETDARYGRARRDASGDAEGKDAATDATLVRLAGEDTVADSVAAIAIGGAVLVEGGAAESLSIHLRYIRPAARGGPIIRLAGPLSIAQLPPGSGFSVLGSAARFPAVSPSPLRLPSRYAHSGTLTARRKLRPQGVVRK